MPGFKFRYRLCGAPPTIEDLTFKDTETLSKGDLANLESGEIDLAATADTNLLGAILETQAGVDSTTKAKVITDADAVYGVTDANARVKGATAPARPAARASRPPRTRSSSSSPLRRRPRRPSCGSTSASTTTTRPSRRS